jgi:centriolar protein POC1
LLQHYDASEDPVTSVAFHPSGRYLVSSSLDATLKIWDLRMGYAVYTLYGHEGATTAVNFSPDGDYLCSGAADSIVMLWLSNLDYSDNAPIPNVNANLTIKGKRPTESIVKTVPNMFTSYEDVKHEVNQELPSSGAMGEIVPSAQAEEGSEEIAGRLDKVVSQLGMITKTLGILEQRMETAESQVAQLIANYQYMESYEDHS